MKDQATFNQSLLKFLQSSPTPYHSVTVMAEQLLAAGFQPLAEADSWQLAEKGRYFVIRDGSIIAWRRGTDPLEEQGIRLLGAHTDSPCLKVKPRADLVQQHNYYQLGVEVYGGVLLAPWFDRDLSLAGRAHCLMGNQQVKPLLVNVNRPIGVIPSLAIHLNPGVNQNHKINPQTELVPIVGQLKDGNKSPVLKEMVKQHLLDQGHQVQQVLAYELSLYDNQPPAIVGLQDEFIASARLDNLLSCFVALQSLLNTRSQRPCMLVCNDHEEVGSRSASGASGPFLTSVLKRLWGDQYQEQSYQRMLQHSWLISMDNAHGIHPNYPGKHDGNHSPVLNQGPVIKINANQSYASNSGGCAKLVQLAEQQGIPLQYFVSRADMACGSTIGPLTASNSGIETLDVGVATFAMHSIRELAGSADPYYLYQLARAFYDQ